MLKISKYEDLTVFKMGRNLWGYVPYYVHCFFWDDTLIDTGTAFAEKEFLKALEGRPIRRIINTHGHEDHTGNNAVIQTRFSPEILAAEEAIPFIEDPRRLDLRFYQEIVWDYPRGSHAAALGDSLRIGGQEVRVIPAEGHAPGHVCLYVPGRKWLFTGDMFCGIKNIYLRRDEDFGLMLESLERLASLDVDILFCGLKGVVPEGGRALMKKIAYMRSLRDKIRGLANSGWTMKRIRNSLLGREDLMTCVTNGHFSKHFLVENILLKNS